MAKKMFTVVVLALLLSGCAGTRHATLKTEKDGTIVHDDTNISFLQPSINPQDLSSSRARLITAEAQAELTRALAEQIKNGQPTAAANTAGNYVGVIVNDDPGHTAYVPHPELSQRIEIAPGSYAVLYTSRMVNKITIYDGLGNYTVAYTDRRGGVYNGITYHYGKRIHKMR